MTSAGRPLLTGDVPTDGNRAYGARYHETKYLTGYLAESHEMRRALPFLELHKISCFGYRHTLVAGE
jgi:hypothetical protein